MTTIETKKRTLVRAYLAEFKAPIRIELRHGATSVAVACRMVRKRNLAALPSVVKACKDRVSQSQLASQADSATACQPRHHEALPVNPSRMQCRSSSH